jgi:hypothetical protein
MKIIQQGHFDGLCLLYTMMNALKALKYSQDAALTFVKDNSKKWIQLISVTPSLENFVNGYGSLYNEVNSTNEVSVIDAYIHTGFKILQGQRKDNVSVTNLRIEDIETNDFESSVLILCLGKSAITKHYSKVDHWVAIVGKNDNDYLLACSITQASIRDTKKYIEYEDPETKRMYNNTFGIKNLRLSSIYKDYIYQIKLE